MQRYQMYIDGQWVDAASGASFKTVNPYTGQPWATIPRGDERDADRAVQAAHRALTSGPWANLSATARGALLRRLGDLLAEEAERLAAIEVRDNGKLMTETLGAFRYMPQFYYYAAGLADKCEGGVLPLDRPGIFAYTRQEPIGVVVGVTPWNSPLLITGSKLTMALAAGCTFVLKPSEYTSATALELARLVERAGFPPGVFNVVTGFGAEVGEPLVRHPLVGKVTLTGGEVTGRAINQSAAADFKAVDLELGGKSPNIVFADANLDDALNGVAAGIFSASGQSCVAGSRLLVQESIHDDFVARLLDGVRDLRLGDPMDPATQIGPVTTRPQFERILGLIEGAKAEGAICALGGSPLPGDGLFVRPTIFTGVRPDMRIAQEEVFGPVLTVIPFRDDDEALAIANGTRYGLAAGVWTSDMRRAFEMTNRLQAGTVWVNTYRMISVMSPFGGYKHSGVGRENGMEAIKRFQQTKTVWMNYAAPIPRSVNNRL